MVRGFFWIAVAEIIIVLVIVIAMTLTRWVEIQAKIAEAEGGSCGFPEAACKFAEAIGFPKSWLQSETFIWFAILPLLGMSLITFGFLNEIQIFKNTSLNFAIAFLMSFSTIPIGWYVILVVVMFQLMGQVSIVLFAAMFFTGIILYFTRYTFSHVGKAKEYLHRVYDQRFKELDEDEKNTKKTIDELDRLIKDHTNRLIELQKTGAPKTQINEIWQDVVAIEQQIVRKKARLRGIKFRRKMLKKERKMKEGEVEFEAKGKAKIKS